MPDFKPTPPLFSQNVKGKGQTYFFDIRQAKNGNKYLSITESRIKDGQPLRSKITIFAEQLKDFTQAFGLMQEKM